MQQSAIFINDAFDRYRCQWPGETSTVELFKRFLRESPSVFERRHVAGHFTGSAWLVTADGERVLLMHHRKLGRWLQPGGHADGDADLVRVALREAQEETGVIGLSIEGEIFDIDRHHIPARASEPDHWHYDVRYVIRAGEDERFIINPESHALAWRPVTEVAGDTSLDISLRRMAEKWLMRVRERTLCAISLGDVDQGHRAQGALLQVSGGCGVEVAAGAAGSCFE